MPPPHESSPTMYNLSHVPELIHPAVFRHPMKSVVLLRQSAAHNQLFIFAPSITQFILKKTKKSTCCSQEYTNIYHSFHSSLQNQLQKLTAHYVQILSKYITEPSPGTLSNSIARHLELRSARPALRPHQTPETLRVSQAQCHEQSLGWHFSRKESVLLVKELHFVSYGKHSISL